MTTLLSDFPQNIFLLGCLFHDIGKVDGIAGHAGVGAEMAPRIMRRLGYLRPTIEPVQFLIRHHLLLGDVATGFRTLAEAVEAIGNLSRLKALYALTIVDIRALDEHGRKMADRIHTIDRIFEELSQLFLGKTVPTLEEQYSEILRRLQRDYPRRCNQIQRFQHVMPPKYWIVRPEAELFRDLTHLEAIRSGSSDLQRSEEHTSELQSH